MINDDSNDIQCSKRGFPDVLEGEVLKSVSAGKPPDPHLSPISLYSTYRFFLCASNNKPACMPHFQNIGVCYLCSVGISTHWCQSNEDLHRWYS